MAAHSLTAIAYQNLLLVIIAVKLHHMVLWYTPYLRDRLQFAADATPSLLVMNLEEFQSLFAARLDVFDPISRQLNNADLTQLRK